MSGPEDKLAEGWELIRQDTRYTKGIEMDNPTGVGRYLGCEHIVETRISKITGNPVNSIVYDMSEFFQQAVSDYKKLSGTDYLRNVTTPFVPENIDDPRFTKQLSALAARFMEAGEFTE